jgi:hypothetical protein
LEYRIASYLARRLRWFHDPPNPSSRRYLASSAHAAPKDQNTASLLDLNRTIVASPKNHPISQILGLPTPKQNENSS